MIHPRGYAAQSPNEEHFLLQGRIYIYFPTVYTPLSPCVFLLETITQRPDKGRASYW